jgi:hypothetical protein
MNKYIIKHVFELYEKLDDIMNGNYLEMFTKYSKAPKLYKIFGTDEIIDLLLNINKENYIIISNGGYGLLKLQDPNEKEEAYIKFLNLYNLDHELNGKFLILKLDKESLCISGNQLKKGYVGYEIPDWSDADVGFILIPNDKISIVDEILDYFQVKYEKILR